MQNIHTLKFQIPKFRSSQIPKILKSQKIQIPKFQISDIPKLQKFPNSKVPTFKNSKFPKFRHSKFPKSSNFQYVSKRYPKFPNPEISNTFQTLFGVHVQVSFSHNIKFHTVGLSGSYNAIACNYKAIS